MEVCAPCPWKGLPKKKSQLYAPPPMSPHSSQSSPASDKRPTFHRFIFIFLDDNKRKLLAGNGVGEVQELAARE